MRITFYGAAENVTGSKHLIETKDGFRLLLDCGFHQGHRKEAEELNRHLPFEASSINAVILSHAHLDHCGLLPLMVKEGFAGPIYATPATADVARYMLEDSTDIQVSDAEYLNRHLAPGQDPIEPLYTEEDCAAALKLFVPVQYAKQGHGFKQVSEHIRFKLYDAGHILGSAVTFLEIRENKKQQTLAFTGDLGKKHASILCDPEYIAEPVDTLLLEATYGDRLHEPPKDTERVVQEAIEYAIKHQSRILVPAFALGRTQELIYLLHKLFNRHGFPQIPVYLDSPLAIEVTEVFKRHRDVFDSQTWRDFDRADNLPLVFDLLSYTRTRNESMQLNDVPCPVMIIAGSGMMEAGRIRHHLKHHIQDPHTTIMITGYQAANTLGRRIQEGVKRVNILNRQYRVRARIVTVPSLSAHADQRELLDYVAHTKGIKQVYLVHGERDSMTTLSECIGSADQGINTVIPRRGEGFDL